MLLEGEVEELQPLETHFVAARARACVFAIKIGTRLSAYVGTIMSWGGEKRKPQPWLT